MISNINDINDINNLYYEYESVSSTDVENISNEICKYCLDEISEDNNLSYRPCRCNYAIHHKCLATWLENSGRTECEICHIKYDIEYKNVIGLPNKSKEWFKTYRNHIILLLIFFLVPCFGQNDSNISKYMISYDESDCISGENSNIGRIVTAFNPLDTTGIIISACSFFSLFYLFWPIYSHYTDFKFLLKKRIMIIMVIMVIILHILFYIIGNLMIYYFQQPIQFTENNDPGCSQYNQIQIQRYEYFTPINISVITWLIGFTILAGSTVLIIMFIGCIIVIILFFFILIKFVYQLGKCIYNILKNGCCVICCPCFIQQRIIVRDISLSQNI